jgi:phage FluMu protein Com
VNPSDFKIVRAVKAPSSSQRMVPSGDQCRCPCGSMLARMVRDGLELKCRKCKSLILISHEELIEMYRSLNAVPPRLPGSERPR